MFGANPRRTGSQPQDFRSQLREWEGKGFIIPDSVVRMVRAGDVPVLAEEVARVGEAIQSLERLKSEVDSLDTAEFESERDEVELLLRDPSRVAQVEAAVERLKIMLVGGVRAKAQGIYELAVEAGQQASAYLLAGRFDDTEKAAAMAQESLEKAVSVLGTADLGLKEAIATNSEAVQSLIARCQVGRGVMSAQDAAESYEEADFERALKLYDESHDHFQSALYYASKHGLKEESLRATALAEQAESNKERCMKGLDSQSVERLVQEAEDIQSQAEDRMQSGKLLEGRELLQEALQKVDEGFDIAVKREFDARVRLNELRRTINQRLQDASTAISMGISLPDFNAELPALSPQRGPTVRLAQAQPSPYADNNSDLQDRYEIGLLVGTGGQADVYRAQRKADDTLVAIKIPRGMARGEQTLTPRVYDDFVREGRVWGQLVQDNIVRLQETGVDPYPWLAMEFIDGGSLRERIGGLNLQRAIEIGRAICSAVEYAHKAGVMHRDLKPENILFAGEVPKVSDWGLSRRFLSMSNTGDGYSGTPMYSAPEEWSDRIGPGEHASDVYALGIIVYEMVTGRHPFMSADEAQHRPQLGQERIRDKTYHLKPPSKINVNLPRCLDDLVLKSLAWAPEDRLREAYLLGEGLEKIADSLR